MVTLHKRYHHRAPVSAKTLLLGGDLLACVLGGVYTDVEKTMVELQRTTIVQETRTAFQSATQQKFIAAVERLSGRDVLASSPATTSAPTWRSSSSCSSPTPSTPRWRSTASSLRWWRASGLA
jgi:Na+-translocating membrane potential-generating system (MpsC)